MGFLDRLLGRSPQQQGQQYAPQQYAPQGQAPAPTRGTPDDQRAIERYQYLLKTAPPDKIEQAHAEAFAQLTPQQRA